MTEAVNEAIKIIDERKRGIVSGLLTCWKKFNHYLGGGIQTGLQYVIAARPGVGKSAFVNLLIKSLFDKNPGTKVVVLYFNFEMSSAQQIIRKISAALGLPVNHLRSRNLTDEEFQKVVKLRESLVKYNIHFVDIPTNVTNIYRTILKYREKYPNYHLVNVFDHSRLVTDENERDEMVKIGRLSKLCMVLKKKIGCSNIIISQLNRNIESPDRRKTGFEPVLSDIFGADLRQVWYIKILYVSL